MQLDHSHLCCVSGVGVHCPMQRVSKRVNSSQIQQNSPASSVAGVLPCINIPPVPDYKTNQLAKQPAWPSCLFVLRFFSASAMIREGQLLLGQSANFNGSCAMAVWTKQD